MVKALTRSLQDSFDVRSILNAWQGIENILKVEEKYFEDENGSNLFANEVKRCGGLRLLEEI